MSPVCEESVMIPKESVWWVHRKSVMISKKSVLNEWLEKNSLKQKKEWNEWTGVNPENEWTKKGDAANKPYSDDPPPSYC